MAMQNLLASVFSTDRRNIYIALTAPFIGIYLADTAYKWLFSVSTKKKNLVIYRAPKQHLSTSSDGLQNMARHSRDVDSPYGSIRVYEWGPETGRKVLFVHGISTQCIAMAKMANLLVQQGCRVMLFDLFGRGGSDCADPDIYRHDINLFSAQILIVLASSSLDWMHGFTLVGYSLGGGIAAMFTSYFPHLVQTLVLMAPAGILRHTRISVGSRLLHSEVVPPWLAHPVIGSQLISIGFPTMSIPAARLVDGERAVHSKGPNGALEGNSNVYVHASNSEEPVFEGYDGLSPADTVEREVNENPGFLPAFISSMRHAPIYDGHTRWREIGKRCEAMRASKRSDEKHCGLKEGKVLLLLGIDDMVILADETAVDAIDALGSDNVDVIKLPGGHDFPIVYSKRCVQALNEFWRDD